MATNPYNLSQEEIQPIGALTGIGEQESEESPILNPLTRQAMDATGALPDNSYMYPVFQVQSQALPISAQDFQSTYGTSAMPSYDFVKLVQTGQIQYIPSDPIQQQLVEQYEQQRESGELPPDAMPWEDVAKEVGAALVPQIGAKVGANIGAALTDPYLTAQGAGVADKLLAGTKTSLPFGGDLPSQTVGSELSRGYDLVKAGGIGEGQALIPELASQEAAAASGNLDLYTRLNSGGGYDPVQGVFSKPAGTQLANGQTVYNTDALRAEGIVVDKSGGITLGQGSSAKISQGSTALTSASTAPTYWDGVKGRFTSGSTWANAGTMAAVTAGLNIAMGMKPIEAVKSAGASALAYGIGFSLAGPVGGWIASTVAAKPIQKVGSKAVEEVKGALDSVGDVLGDAGKAVQSFGSKAVSVAKKAASPVRSVARSISRRFKKWSDIELKDNIQHIGQTADGINLYSWEWNDKAKEIGIDNYPNKGMIAQDLLATRPEAVFRDDDTGYLAIDYEKLA